jgi:hypothetical protein
VRPISHKQILENVNAYIVTKRNQWFPGEVEQEEKFQRGTRQPARVMDMFIFLNVVMVSCVYLCANTTVYI